MSPSPAAPGNGKPMDIPVPDQTCHQAVFRVLLAALSRPGEIRLLPGACAQTLTEAAKAVCRTLLDHEVGFAVAGAPRQGISPESIRRWTHAPVAPVESADFLILTGPDDSNALIRLHRGTPEMPDTGATAIFLIEDCLKEPGPDAPFTLSGPGIAPPGRRRLPRTGLPDAQILTIREANADFPMGIDCFFLDPAGAVMGLPRSTRIERSA